MRLRLRAHLLALAGILPFNRLEPARAPCIDDLECDRVKSATHGGICDQLDGKLGHDARWHGLRRGKGAFVEAT